MEAPGVEWSSPGHSCLAGEGKGAAPGSNTSPQPLLSLIRAGGDILMWGKLSGQLEPRHRPWQQEKEPHKGRATSCA